MPLELIKEPLTLLSYVQKWKPKSRPPAMESGNEIISSPEPGELVPFPVKSESPLPHTIEEHTVFIDPERMLKMELLKQKDIRKYGVVNAFYEMKGYGFIRTLEQEELFVHKNRISEPGVVELTPGLKVTYLLQTDDKGRLEANDVRYTDDEFEGFEILLAKVQNIKSVDAPGERRVGVVNTFNSEKGYGFIGGKNLEELFVHKNRIIEPGLDFLRSGQKVSYILQYDSKGRLEAAEVRIVKSKKSETSPDKNAERLHGVVNTFYNDKGYGFIKGSDGKEIFVHKHRIAQEGIEVLHPGQKVNYTVANDDKGRAEAQDVKIFSAKGERNRGRILQYNDERCFGFIMAYDGGADVFFHLDDVRCDDERPETFVHGYIELYPGQFVEYKLLANDAGKRRADDITGPNQETLLKFQSDEDYVPVMSAGRRKFAWLQKNSDNKPFDSVRKPEKEFKRERVKRAASDWNYGKNPRGEIGDSRLKSNREDSHTRYANQNDFYSIDRLDEELPPIEYDDELPHIEDDSMPPVEYDEPPRERFASHEQQKEPESQKSTYSYGEPSSYDYSFRYATLKNPSPKARAPVYSDPIQQKRKRSDFLSPSKRIKSNHLVTASPNPLHIDLPNGVETLKITNDSHSDLLFKFRTSNPKLGVSKAIGLLPKRMKLRIQVFRNSSDMEGLHLLLLVVKTKILGKPTYEDLRLEWKHMPSEIISTTKIDIRTHAL